MIKIDQTGVFHTSRVMSIGPPIRPANWPSLPVSLTQCKCTVDNRHTHTLLRHTQTNGSRWVNSHDMYHVAKASSTPRIGSRGRAVRVSVLLPLPAASDWLHKGLWTGYRKLEIIVRILYNSPGAHCTTASPLVSLRLSAALWLLPRYRYENHVLTTSNDRIHGASRELYNTVLTHSLSAYRQSLEIAPHQLVAQVLSSHPATFPLPMHHISGLDQSHLDQTGLTGFTPWHSSLPSLMQHLYPLLAAAAAANGAGPSGLETNENGIRSWPVGLSGVDQLSSGLNDLTPYAKNVSSGRLPGDWHAARFGHGATGCDDFAPEVHTQPRIYTSSSGQRSKPARLRDESKSNSTGR
ncbi:unnamed protein product [Protopolystoma xenopodis]|uniref:Uncharacterized protein n=1 Tax=Protopolystoma xenopodis TaxID=117903 RepID=A0A3S5A0M0_9PLAT|nr:unnamed protein product [Protopolystoma xenopodis]